MTLCLHRLVYCVTHVQNAAYVLMSPPLPILCIWFKRIVVIISALRYIDRLLGPCYSGAVVSGGSVGIYIIAVKNATDFIR